jgi:osmoprotectant transport system ATP-binding protein
MDEPFGATRPITRARLQDEFLRIPARPAQDDRVVTHDIDERAAWATASRSCATARSCSTHARGDPRAPADDFVASFVGADRALKRLALVEAHEAMEAGSGRRPGRSARMRACATRWPQCSLQASTRSPSSIRPGNGSAC